MKFSTMSVFLVAFGLVGCSAERDATTRRLDELQTKISRLEASSSALRDRMEAVEARPEAPAAVTEALVDDDRPELAVVEVRPETNEIEAPPMPPESDEERPSIVGDRHKVEQVDEEPKARAGHGRGRP